MFAIRIRADLINSNVWPVDVFVKLKPSTRLDFARGKRFDPPLSRKLLMPSKPPTRSPRALNSIFKGAVASLKDSSGLSSDRFIVCGKPEVI